MSDPLIDRLVRDLSPVRARRWGRDALWLALACVAELALFLLVGPTRPDMPAAMEMPSWWWKLGATGTIAVAGFAVALLSLDPTRSPRRGLRALGAVVLAALAAGWAVDAGRDGAAALWTRLDWVHGLQCAWEMAALSVPATLALGLVIRRGAPTDRAGTAWAAAIASGAWGAFVFVFACPSDDPFYIAVWYMVGCGATAAMCRILFAALSRW
ncbi:NrsF family protein [Rhizosaccharibacter radicis]|uniref:DUF1109 domain-containing protein n=1 Tax=Rhizosaccharibacter radicis TaxID=2782605 RepID=A0ABT1VTS0_9PROT|nr:DUF1109 domain-containing protein [Acetobacteraceae bacterium KSS12]